MRIERAAPVDYPDIETLLAEAGLSAYALAQKSGVRQQTLSKLLRGERQPSLAMALRLCRALGASLAVFDGLLVRE